MKRTLPRLLTVGAICSALTIAIPGFAHNSVAHAAAGAPQVSESYVVPAGTASFNVTAAQSGSAGPEINTSEREVDLPNRDATGPSGSLITPDPVNTGLAATNPGFTGFAGLNHVDSRTADGGNAFSLEPPDQGLCTGNSYVLEAVNDVMTVYNTSGTRLVTPKSLNSFFNLPYSINRTTGVRGDFLSDPKCYYDVDTNRWFLTTLQQDPAPSVRAHTLIAVSTTGDPTGQWNLFSLDATDDGKNGTPSNPGCPCFGDQPLIGADQYGFYISTNEFGDGFNGAQVYALSKTGLENATSGTLPRRVVHFSNLVADDAGDMFYSVQPATAPNAQYDLTREGSEYFLSALQFGPAPLDNRIAVWGLTHTKSLNQPNEKLALTSQIISSETYGQPQPVTQKAGALTLGTSLGQPENQLNSNDDRMNQVVFAKGRLWGGLNTLISGGRTGIAYFIVNPGWNNDQINGTIAKQGYLAVAGNSVMFPSIGVNSAGKGVMTFTLAGPDYYPSAAYAPIDDVNGAGAIHIASAGAEPADGFTGYAPYGGNGVERWGDYSAAVPAADGSIWLAAEYIAGGPRTSLANWSTFVSHVTP